MTSSTVPPPFFSFIHACVIQKVFVEEDFLRSDKAHPVANLFPNKVILPDIFYPKDWRRRRRTFGICECLPSLLLLLYCLVFSLAFLHLSLCFIPLSLSFIPPLSLSPSSPLSLSSASATFSRSSSFLRSLYFFSLVFSDHPSIALFLSPHLSPLILPIFHFPVSSPPPPLHPLLLYSRVLCL